VVEELAAHEAARKRGCKKPRPAERLGVAPKWLYRRKNTLPFMREIVPGTWRVSVSALERWMRQRGRRSPLTGDPIES